jgi:hypothetical protein
VVYYESRKFVYYESISPGERSSISMPERKKKKRENGKAGFTIEMTGVGFSISGSAAPTTERRAVTANSSSVKRQSSAGQADEIALGSCLPAGLSDVELENICRLQYARWKDVQEYVAAVGSMPDVWPESGLFKVRFPSQSRCCDGFSFVGQFIAALWSEMITNGPFTCVSEECGLGGCGLSKICWMLFNITDKSRAKGNTINRGENTV